MCFFGRWKLRAGGPKRPAGAWLLLFLRFEGDDHVFRRLVAQGLYGVFLLKFSRGRFEGHLLGSLFGSGFNGDGGLINTFEFCERLTDVRLTTCSGDSGHTHRVGGRALVIGETDGGEQQRDHRCQNVCDFHVVGWLVWVCFRSNCRSHHSRSADFSRSIFRE